jgi:hypothetical protein
MYSPVAVTGGTGVLPVQYTWKKFESFDIEHDRIQLCSKEEYEVEEARVRHMVSYQMLLPAMLILSMAHGRSVIVDGLVASYLSQSPIVMKTGRAFKDRNRWRASVWINHLKHYFGVYDTLEQAVQAACIGVSRLDRGLPCGPKVIKPIVDQIWNQA